MNLTVRITCILIALEIFYTVPSFGMDIIAAHGAAIAMDIATEPSVAELDEKESKRPENSGLPAVLKADDRVNLEKYQLEIQQCLERKNLPTALAQLIIDYHIIETTSTGVIIHRGEDESITFEADPRFPRAPKIRPFFETKLPNGTEVGDLGYGNYSWIDLRFLQAYDLIWLPSKEQFRAIAENLGSRLNTYSPLIYENGKKTNRKLIGHMSGIWTREDLSLSRVFGKFTIFDPNSGGFHSEEDIWSIFTLPDERPPKSFFRQSLPSWLKLFF